MNSLIIPNKQLFTGILQDLSEGKRVKIQAQGNSMFPFLRDKQDRIVLGAVDRPLKKGMIVLAEIATGKFVIHRIEKINAESVLLRGDGNLYQRENCSHNQVLARVVAVVRGNKIINEDGFYWHFYRYLCPNHSFLRKISLAIYRVIF